MCDKCTSPIERKFHEAFIRLHPKWAEKFIPQFRIGIDGIIADFAWEEFKTIIEVDSRQYHSSPEAIAHDKARDDRMHKIGWHTIRVWGPDIHASPDTAAHMIYVQLRAYVAGRSMEHYFRGEVKVAKDITNLSEQAKQRVYPNPIEMMLLKSKQGPTPEDR